MYIYNLISEDYLMHHGVKGMKWGVRHDPERKTRKLLDALDEYDKSRKAHNKNVSTYWEQVLNHNKSRRAAEKIAGNQKSFKINHKKRQRLEKIASKTRLSEINVDDEFKKRLNDYYGLHFRKESYLTRIKSYR